MKRTVALFTLVFVLSTFAACGRSGEQSGTETKGTETTAQSGIIPGLTDDTRETVAAPATETAVSGAQGNGTAGKKTADEAKGIAFTHAGVSEADVRDLEVDLESEGSSEYYDIDFKVERIEYSYDIDAYTGEILRSKKEMD